MEKFYLCGSGSEKFWCGFILPKNMIIEFNRILSKAIEFYQRQSNSIKGNQTHSKAIEFSKVFGSIEFQSFNYVRLLSIDSIIEFFN